MTTPFLSIIIPVYNGSKTIQRTLNSIWDQGFVPSDFEVICVDDYSTDNTLEVLYREAESHPQLKILKNPENLRAGGARNNGVRNAQGRFLVFIDCDDYFYDHSLKFALDYQKSNNLDILMLDYSRQTSVNQPSATTLNFKNSDIMSGVDFIKINTCPYGPCKFIFKRDLMVNNNIRFEEKCCCEDVDWCFRLVYNAETIQYLRKVLSCVIINSRSQTAVEHKSIRTISDKMFAANRLLQFAESSADITDDKQLYDYTVNVANLYLYEGVKYMTACNAPINVKREILKKYIPDNIRLRPIVARAHNHPILYAVASNIASFAVPYLISLKRALFKR